MVAKISARVAALGLASLALGACSANEAIRPAPMPRSASPSEPSIAEGDRPEPADRVVLVELFTSEGCSSCPPADRLLAELVDDRHLDVVAVAYHVDYWDYLGWKDRFSQAAWSKRQRRYARAHRSGRVYTPQLLFDGEDHAVGRRAAAARQAIDDAEQSPTWLELGIEPTAQGRRPTATVTISGIEAGHAAGDVLMVALVENDQATNVPAGENAGRRLYHEAIALDLVEACTLGTADTQRCEARLDARHASARADLQLVAFVQDPQTMRVVQAARVDL